MKRKNQIIIGFVSAILTFGTLAAVAGRHHNWHGHRGHECQQENCTRSCDGNHMEENDMTQQSESVTPQ